MPSPRDTGAILILLASWVQMVLTRPFSTPYKHSSLRSLFRRSADGPWFIDFPDPGLLQDSDGTFYAYSTNAIPTGAGSLHVPVARSGTIDSGWEIVTDSSGAEVDAMPALPPWIAPGGNQVWAPDVIQLSDGSYSMLFASPGNQTGANPGPNGNFFCIGIASSNTPTGPFTSTDQPLYCDDGQSIIDGSHFTDVDGTNYFLYSGAGNLNIYPLDSSNTVTQGEPTQILAADPAIDNAGVTEAPFMINADGSYFLFYSTGTYSQPDYNVFYSTSEFLLGPYARQGPLLQTGDAIDGTTNTLLGPGGATLIPNGNGGYYMVGPPSSLRTCRSTMKHADADLSAGIPRPF